MATINDGVTIDSGLEASKMRRKMESKDTLATKGALYVGTGIPDKDLFTVTKSIAPSGADDDNKVLVADSGSTVGWTIKECPMATEATTATTVSTNIGEYKITDIFESGEPTAKTATMAKGLQSDTAQSANGTNWYEFNGRNEYFGSANSPTIIKTSDPRPKAEVKSGETTVTKEIALEEDIPQVGEWVTITTGTNGADSKVTEAGTYEVTVLDTYELLAFYGTTLVHWDGSGQIAQSVYTNTNLDSSNNTVALYTTHVVIRIDGTLAVKGGVLQRDNTSTAKWHYSLYDINKYKFRKVF
jgi:hypothetical protein